MIKIKHSGVHLTVNDLRSIIQARKENEQLVREVIAILRRYDQQISVQPSISGDHRISDEELKAVLAKDCWTEIPHHYLSIDDRRHQEVLQLTMKRTKDGSGEGVVGSGNLSDVKQHVETRNKTYALVLRENPRKPVTPFVITVGKPLALSFRTLWERRRVTGEKVSIDKVNPAPSVFRPLFSGYKPDNASIEALSEEEREVFKKEVLPGKYTEEGEEVPKQIEEKKEKKPVKRSKNKE